MRKRPLTCALALTGAVILGSCGPAESTAAPPSLEEQVAITDIVAYATFVKPVANAATDDSTVEFVDVEVLWSGDTRTMADGSLIETPDPPDPLTAWALWQELDENAKGERLLLGLAYSPQHPYGQWHVTLALDPEKLSLPGADLDKAADGEILGQVASDLAVLFAANGPTADERIAALVALIVEQREALFARNLGEVDPPVGPMTALLRADDPKSPTQEEILAAWRQIPPELRSLLFESEIPAGHGLSFSPLNVVLVASPGLENKYDGVRFVTNEGYVLTHILPLGYEALPLSQKTVTGLPIRVYLYQNPSVEGAKETLVEVGVIQWAELEESAAIRVTLAEPLSDISPMPIEEYQQVLNNPKETANTGG